MQRQKRNDPLIRKSPDAEFKIALWCNGSTPDSGSVCESSSLSKATNFSLTLPCGVMVAHRILVPFVRVRVFPRQLRRLMKYFISRFLLPLLAVNKINSPCSTFSDGVCYKFVRRIIIIKNYLDSCLRVNLKLCDPKNILGRKGPHIPKTLP